MPWTKRVRLFWATVRNVGYELVIAALSISTGWRILADPLSVVSAIMHHAPLWEARALAIGLVAGGTLTVMGVVGAAVNVSPVRRIVARRLEEFGQILLSGMFIAPALAAFSLGSAGRIQALFDLGFAAAAALRVLQMRSIFSSPLPPEFPEAT